MSGLNDSKDHCMKISQKLGSVKTGDMIMIEVVAAGGVTKRFGSHIFNANEKRRTKIKICGTTLHYWKC